jgi:hypothetical protein
MILVRDVFRLKFGKAKEARTLMKQGDELAARAGQAPQRHLMDLVGPYYTLVLESTYASLAAWENAHANVQLGAEWEAWYEKFKAVVDSGYREIFTVVEGR